MAPHSMNDHPAGNNDQNHRRAKSHRVAPAIPYALVKPKAKATPSINSSTNSVKSKPVTPSLENVEATTPVQAVPSTPASIASSQDKGAPSSATATDGVSDRNLDSEGSKPSASSEVTSSPATQAAISPKLLKIEPTQSSLTSPTTPSASAPELAHNTDTAASYDESGEGQADAYGFLAQNRQHVDRPTNGRNGHTSANSDVAHVPHIANGAQAVQLNTAAIMPPPGMVPPAYNAEFMSPPITSPISGWNPNANFIPPSHQVHASRRSMYDSMSPRAASHKSSTSEVHPTKSIVPLSFTQPLPPIDIFPWSSYINTFYSNSRFADFSLVPSKTDTNRGAPEFPVHGLIISKSSVLSQLISRLSNNPKRNENGQIYLSLAFDEKVTSYRAILEAIGHLYGQPLPHYGEGLPLNAPAEVIMDRIISALSLAGAGQFLGLPEVMSHGLAFAIDFINWHTFEKALAFAQASMNSLSSFQEADNRSNELIKVMYHYHSNLMFRLERFLIDNFPRKFQFLPSAPELNEARRLPLVGESRPSVSHARLASIQFGDMPTPDPSLVHSDTLLSSILLSIPTAIIGRFLESPELAKKLGRVNLVNMLGDIINEREKRRMKAVKSRGSVSNISSTQEDELNWMEVLEQYPQSLFGVVVSKVPADRE